MSATPLPCPELPFATLPAEAGPLLLALSGGLDSVALLSLLARSPEARQRGLRAVHIDHGLQPDAAAWGQHCLALCARLEIECTIQRLQLAPGAGLEARARDARYAALAAELKPGEVLVTAHHLDDQAETFLLRALRGAGERGLGAMRPLRPFGPGWLWRPLLQVPRALLEAHARDAGLAWVEDPSNASLDHDRNFLRHAVLPLLRQRWPQAAASLALAAQRSADADARLAQADAVDLALCQGLDPRRLDLRPLRSFDPARRARVLRAFVEAGGAPQLPLTVLGQIERELLDARPDSDASAGWRGWTLRAWRGSLHLLPPSTALPEGLDLAWDGRAPLALPDGALLGLCDGQGAWVEERPLPVPLWVRPRRGGERFRHAAGRPSRSLRILLQELGLPPWLRTRLPLLVDASGELKAVGDLLLAEDLGQALHARGLCLRWRLPEGPTATQRD